MTGSPNLKDFKKFEVKVALSELLDNDFEGFLDLISELATGTQLLMDISYEIIGVDAEEQAVIFSVIGDTSAIEEEEEEDDG